MSTIQTDVLDEALQNNLNIRRAKCILLGQPEVGKTCLIERALRLTKDQTIEVDRSKDSELQSQSVSTTANLSFGPNLHRWNCNNFPVELFVLDCTGRSMYYRWINQLVTENQNGWLVIAVFDLTRPATLASVRQRIVDLWPEIKLNKTSVKTKQTNPSRLGVLVGTRADQLTARQVTSEEALHLARQLEFGYFECNLLEGVDALQPFHFLAEKLIELESQN